MFGGLCFSLFCMVTGFMISAPSSQPGKQLGSCRQGKTSWKRHRLLNKEIAWGGKGGNEACLSQNLVPKCCWLCGRQRGSWKGEERVDRRRQQLRRREKGGINRCEELQRRKQRWRNRLLKENFV